MLTLLSYARGESPPFAVFIVVYGISLALPFVLAGVPGASSSERDSVSAVARGTSLGFFTGAIVAVPTVVAGNWINLLDTQTQIVVGLPMIFAGSTLLPFLATAKSSVERIIASENGGSVISRSSFPPFSFVVFILAILTRAFPPRKILLRQINGILVMLVFPLTLGWLLVAKSIGPVLSAFPLLYYALLVLWTRHYVLQLGVEEVEQLGSSMRSAASPLGPPTLADVAYIMLVSIIYVLLIVGISRSIF